MSDEHVSTVGKACAEYGNSSPDIISQIIQYSRVLLNGRVGAAKSGLCPSPHSCEGGGSSSRPACLSTQWITVFFATVNNS